MAEKVWNDVSVMGGVHVRQQIEPTEMRHWRKRDIDKEREKDREREMLLSQTRSGDFVVSWPDGLRPLPDLDSLWAAEGHCRVVSLRDCAGGPQRIVR